MQLCECEFDYLIVPFIFDILREFLKALFIQINSYRKNYDNFVMLLPENDNEYILFVFAKL